MTQQDSNLANKDRHKNKKQTDLPMVAGWQAGNLTKIIVPLIGHDSCDGAERSNERAKVVSGCDWKTLGLGEAA